MLTTTMQSYICNISIGRVSCLRHLFSLTKK